MPPIIESLDVFLDDESDNSVLVKKLIERGFSKSTSERIIVFAPVTFGRKIIENIADVIFSKEYEVEIGEGQWASHRLADDKTFIELLELSNKIYTERSLGKENFYAIANRSWELSAINKIIHDLDEKTDKLDLSMLNGTKLSAMKIFGYDTFIKDKPNLLKRFMSQFSGLKS